MFLAAGRFPDGEEIDRLLEWIDQPRVIVDVGANIGVYTVALAKIFPSATVIPLEPDAAVTEVLRKNVALNGLENVALDHLGKAVGAAATRGRLVRDPAGDSVYSRVELQEEGDVEVVRLDDLGLADVDLMKIDVEGAEFDVLDGAAELLAGQPALLLEIPEQSYAKLVSFLTRYRYFIAFSVPREEYANYFLKPALCRVDGLPGKTRA
jgi:FkbM family methyltransferase